MYTFDVEAVKNRLASFGYTVKDTDELAITFSVDKVTSTIKNEINWQYVPDGLFHIAVDMACGEFLMYKLTFSPDDLDIDLDTAVSELREGDTTVRFGLGDGSTTPEQRLTSFINYLLNYGKDEFNSFRRLRW